MLKKISRKNFLNAYPDFPTANYRTDEYNYPNSYDGYILYVEARSTKGLCSNVSKELSKLLNLLGYTTVSFLGDTTTPWLFRSYDYKPLASAHDFLLKNNISKKFNGAIAIDSLGMVEFFKHLFWLIRCNGIIFTLHFSDTNINIVGTICQYGNIHLSTLNKEADKLLHEKLQLTKFTITDKSKCTGRIFGRTASLV